MHNDNVCHRKCKMLICGVFICVLLGTWQIGDEQKEQEETFQTAKSKFPRVFENLC